MELKFDANGLIPAVVFDNKTGAVLMLAYMNAESLEITKNEGYTCFFSRERNKLWRKGETSGNTQKVVSITADCDLDALLIEVIPEGPACHTNAESCFFNTIIEGEGPFSFKKLYNLILSRKNDKPDGSYTASLFEKGIEKILKKVGEEASEVIIAGIKHNFDEAVYEIADLVYHVMVFMANEGISIENIEQELARRHKFPKQ